MGYHAQRVLFQVWPSLPREGLLPGLLAGEPARLRHTGKVCASRDELRADAARVMARGAIPCLTHVKRPRPSSTEHGHAFFPSNASGPLRALAFAFVGHGLGLTGFPFERQFNRDICQAKAMTYLLKLPSVGPICSRNSADELPGPIPACNNVPR